MMKRLLCLLVTMTMLVALLPLTVVAENAPQPTTVASETPAKELQAAEEPEKEPEAEPETLPEPPAQEPQEGDSTEGSTEGGTAEAPDPTTDPADPLPPTPEEAEQIAAANAAIAALPDEITWAQFADVEAAGAALAAVPLAHRAAVENAQKLAAAIDALCLIYAQAAAALDPSADAWENQQAIKAFAEMKAMMDAAIYVKPSAPGLMSDGADAALDMRWIDEAMAAFLDAEATIIPEGAELALLEETHEAKDYQTLQSAINEAVNGDTVLVKKSFTTSGSLTLSNTATYTIDTNRKTVTIKGISNLFDVTNGHVTLVGGGTLRASPESQSSVFVCAQGTDTTLSIDGVTFIDPSQAAGVALLTLVDGATTVVSNSQWSGNRGIVVSEGTLLMSDSTLTARSDESLLAGWSSWGDTSVTLDGVTFTTAYETVLGLYQFGENAVSVTVKNSTFTSTVSGKKPVTIDCNDAMRANISFENSIIRPCMVEDDLPVADGQFLFDGLSGSSLVMPSLLDALALDGVGLRGDYALDGSLTLEKGDVLDLRGHQLITDAITVNGKLSADSASQLTPPVTVSDTGTLTIGGIPYIAPKASDKSSEKPVFGLHEGASMTAQYVDDKLALTVLQGDVTIQRGITDVDSFFLGSDHSLEIGEGQTVWLASDVGYASKQNVTGDIQYIVATDGKGKNNYATLQEAVEKNSSVKLVRDVAGPTAMADTITIDKSLTIDLGGHTIDAQSVALLIEPTKKASVAIKNGAIRSPYEPGIVANGQEGALLTLTLTDLTITGGVSFGDHIKLTIKNCEIASQMEALQGTPGIANAEVSIEGGALTSTLADGSAIYTPSVKKLTIKNTTVTAARTGIEVKAGDVALTNVTVNAGTGSAIVVVANKLYGLPGERLNLRVSGGTITSSQGNAIAYGYENGITSAQKPMRIEIDGMARLVGMRNQKSLLVVGEDAPTVNVTAMFATPSVGTEQITMAKGSHCFAWAYSGYSSTIVSKTLAEALQQETRGTFVLKADYENKGEDLFVRTNTDLSLGSYDLTVRSITAYGGLTSYGGEIEAKRLDKYGSGSVTLYNAGDGMHHGIDALGENTVLNLRSLGNAGRYSFPELLIYDKTGRRDSIVAQTLEDQGVFYVRDDAHIAVRRLETEDGNVAELTVVSGRVTIYNAWPHQIDLGNKRLRVMPGAVVTVADGRTLLDNGHITGDILYPEVVELARLLSELPDDPKDLTYLHDSRIEAALTLQSRIQGQGHGNTATAKAAFAKLDRLSAAFADACFQTAPVNQLVETAKGGTIERQGAAIDVSTFRLNLQDVSDQLFTQYGSDTFSMHYELSDPDGFKIENGMLTTTESAELGDVLTLTRYVQNDDKNTRTADIITTYRVLSIKASTHIENVVLGGYSYTVNLAQEQPSVIIPCAYATSDGMLYDSFPYSQITGGRIDGEGKNQLDEAFTIDAVEGGLRLTANENAKKGVTYTGRISPTVLYHDTPNYLPLTALVSVKVVDAAPKVTVKLDALDLFYNQVGSPSSGYRYLPVGVTIGGANAEYVEEIEVDKLGDVTFETVNKKQALILTSPHKLTKGTLKPVVRVKFTAESGYKDMPVKATLKLVQNVPGVKLAKKTATVAGNARERFAIKVQPDDPTTNITGVSLWDQKGNEPFTAVSVSYAAQDPTTLKPTLRFTIDQALTTDAKLLCRLSVADTDETFDLPLTLQIKPWSAKLGQSTLTVNLKSHKRTFEVPLVIVPETGSLWLRSVNGHLPQEGSATVDGVVFTCRGSNVLGVDVSGAALAKGNTKYSVLFEGIPNPLTLTLSVIDKYQTVKLSKSSVTLNATISNDSFSVPIVYSDGTLTQANFDVIASSNVKIQSDAGAINGSIYRTAANTETVLLTVKDAFVDPKKATLKLTIKKNVKPVTMKASVQGKLDPMNPDSTVVVKLTLSGSANAFDLKNSGKHYQQSDFTLTGHSALAIKGFDNSSGVVLTVGWRDGANLYSGAGKYQANITLASSALGFTTSLSKPISIVAAAPKIKLTTAPVVLHEIAPYTPVPVRIDAGNPRYTIKSVSLAKPSGVYLLDHNRDGLFISYQNASPDFGKTWKANDSVKLNVTLEGSKNVYSVTLPIVNVQWTKRP